ncbi:MAG: tol-pal system-associated acyl-CoA thioesterase [Hyphomicrobiales bacterium]
MSEAWPDLAGRIEGGRHLLPIRVYYEDTDFSGAVYHANYLKFCERGRSDCLRLLGIHHHVPHWHETQRGIGFVVRRLVCEFLKPARIDDLLAVETRFVEMVGARLEIEQKVRRGGESLFEAQVTVALVDAQGRPRRVARDMAKAMALMPQAGP